MQAPETKKCDKCKKKRDYVLDASHLVFAVFCALFCKWGYSALTVTEEVACHTIKYNDIFRHHYSGYSWSWNPHYDINIKVETLNHPYDADWFFIGKVPSENIQSMRDFYNPETTLKCLIYPARFKPLKAISTEMYSENRTSRYTWMEHDDNTKETFLMLGMFFFGILGYAMLVNIFTHP